MNHIYKSFGIIVLMTVIVFAMAGCSNGSTAGDPPLEGNLHISDASEGAAITTAYTDNYLYAVYDGSESGITYQWKKDGINIADETDASILAAEAGAYTVTLSAAGFSSKTSEAVTVSVSSEPQLGALHISGTPTGTVITTANTPVTLYAVYTPVGSETVSYQWKKGGIDIVGETSVKYTATTAGDYTVSMSAVGFAGKTSAKVTVSLSSLEGTPHISNTAGGAVIPTATAPITLYTVYGGSEAVSYQWNKDGSPIDSATSVSYNATTAGNYTVTVSAVGYSGKTSEAVTVSASPLEGSLHISTTDGGAAVSAAKTSDTLYVVYDGDETVTYQWNKDGSPIDSATSVSYNATTAGNYTVTVSAVGYSGKTSEAVTVSASPLEGSLHISTTDGGAAVSAAKTSDTLYVVYDGDETVTYQWKKNGTSLDGATSRSYKPTTAGDYTVTLSAVGYADKTSAKVAVTLPPLEGELSIITKDVYGNINRTDVTEADTSETLWTDYDDEDVTLTYQWKKNGNPVTDGTEESYSPTTAGQYTVTISAEGYEPKTSSPVTVTLVTLRGGVNVFDEVNPFSNISVTDVPITATLYAKYGGTEDVTLTYQWNKNGNPIPGATQDSYQINSGEGEYSVTIGAEGYEPKTSATVTAYTTTTITITGLPQNYWNSSITLTIYEVGENPDDYIAIAEATIDQFEDDVTFTTTYNNTPVFIKGEYLIRIIHHSGGRDWTYFYTDEEYENLYYFKGINTIPISMFPGAE